MPLEIRPARTDDLTRLLEINNASTPGVNGLDAHGLSTLAGSALQCLVAVAAGEPVAFLLCLGEGTDYDSRNYRWFCERLARFAYIDRICVAPEGRGGAIGHRLYAALADRLAGSGLDMVCEVNERPPNPGSLRFHARLGFREVGRQDHGDKAVVYLRHPTGVVPALPAAVAERTG
ncbi:GNAT family N-acetyltransferase [Polymorphum gilvum]|nr:GNAT family N-acetyltransferase [Polymorphum gilvum]